MRLGNTGGNACPKVRDFRKKKIKRQELNIVREIITFYRKNSLFYIMYVLIKY